MELFCEIFHKLGDIPGFNSWSYKPATPQVDLGNLGNCFPSSSTPDAHTWQVAQDYFNYHKLYYNGTNKAA
jgi:hypothetical protein